ncbi:MAG: hypothetical protein ABI665_12540 [Vicinamibacterales bacterium]
MIVLLAVVTTAAILGMPRPGLAGAPERGYVAASFLFELAGSSGGVIKSVDDEGVTAEIVNEAPPNSLVGDASCNVGVTFFNGEGLVLFASELRVGPGQIGSVELPAVNFPKGGPFHVTFQVLDEKKNGKVRPCIALPSARVFDRNSGKTMYYLPIVTN